MSVTMFYRAFSDKKSWQYRVNIDNLTRRRAVCEHVYLQRLTSDMIRRYTSFRRWNANRQITYEYTGTWVCHFIP